MTEVFHDDSLCSWPLMGVSYRRCAARHLETKVPAEQSRIFRPDLKDLVDRSARSRRWRVADLWS
jgi:hypothetical protein